MGTALNARRRAELPPLLADLPGRGPRGWLPPGWTGTAAWAGSVVTRLRGALPVRDSEGRAGLSPSPVPARGITRTRHAAPGSPPAPAALLPFPRDAAASFTIGRDYRCDMAIDDITVSRRHARLERGEAGGWLLADLGSRNGTRVNGWRVRDPVEVRAGDLVRFGDAEYVLADDPADPVTAPAIDDGGPDPASR